MLHEDSRKLGHAAPLMDQERASPVLQKNWQDLIKPAKLSVASGRDSKRLGTVVAEPLERGFGLTLGNALRRVLLSSLQGAAITSVHIDGVLHEFSSIAGVREDVTDIVLNIKEVALRIHSDGVKRMVLRKEGPGVVLARDIEAGADVEILNPNHVICTVDEGATVRMEFTASLGKGYVPSERNRPEDAPIGLIPVDSLYSPVKKVSYRVSNTREGQILDYDKLTMEIETDGSINPKILWRSLRAFFRISCRSSSTSRSPARKSARSARRISNSTPRCSRRSTSWSFRSVRRTA